jgi:hypothetical protein
VSEVKGTASAARANVAGAEAATPYETTKQTDTNTTNNTMAPHTRAYHPSETVAGLPIAGTGAYNHMHLIQPTEPWARRTQTRRQTITTTTRTGTSPARTPSRRARTFQATNISWNSTMRTRQTPRRQSSLPPAKVKKQLQEQEMREEVRRHTPDERAAKGQDPVIPPSSSSLFGPNRTTSAPPSPPREYYETHTSHPVKPTQTSKKCALEPSCPQ